MGNKYKKFAAARADMLPIKVQILNYFTNFKDKSTDRMPNVVVDLPDLRIPKYFSHSAPDRQNNFLKLLFSLKAWFTYTFVWFFSIDTSIILALFDDTV